ncbi:hypothetical protein BDY24DRAFT_76162 [Mrakia frigida]|uniref:uncharacterized protein n=1 Tax=Mrakia frigida TaxID=29902 RepID=UPI003FCBFC72
MFGGLSRADLEKERLARANKRQLTDDSNGASSSSSQQPPSKKPRPSNTTARIMTFGDLPKDGDDEDGAPSGGGSGGGGGGVERIGTGDRFFDGEKGYGFTTNNLCAAPGKYFGIRELIGDTSTLKLAIVSTYCFEPELVASLFPTSVPTVLVSHPPAKEAAGKSFHGTSVPGIWSCYPYLPPWPGGGEGRFRGVCHMKFMLLFYDDGRLRIVIMSANFMAFDFKSIENGVWVQDFHPRTSQEVVKVDFGNQWEMILEALGLPATFRLINPVHHNLPFRQTSDIHNWDFSSVKVRLVASLGGKKEGWKAMEKVGQCRLGKVLRDEGWVPGDGRVLKIIELSGSETEDEDGQPLSLSTKSTQPNGKGKEREVEVEVVEKQIAGWIYMGSHNFTPSAWGNLSMRKDGTPGQDGANYELGIIIPLTSDDPQAEANKLTTWKRPARRYTERDLPWMQYEHNLEGGHGVGRSD